MTKEFCNYTQSLALKELGFDEPCLGYYNSNNEFTFFVDVRSCNTNSEFGFYPTSPTFSQAFRWFRERYGWVAEINSLLMSGNYFARLVKPSESRGYDIKMCGTYEDAELECLIKLIEIVKKESNG